MASSVSVVSSAATPDRTGESGQKPGRAPIRGGRGFHPVPGTPRWAVICAWVTVASVLPSCAWRTAVGLGVPLGWSEAHLRLEHIPGDGTSYVVRLSGATIVAAALTLGLVYRWGGQVPARVPLLGGRRLPLWPVAAVAVAGVIVVSGIVGLSIAHWSSVSGFSDRPTSGWALLMAACYAPALLWPSLLLAVTLAYIRRCLETSNLSRPCSQPPSEAERRPGRRSALGASQDHSTVPAGTTHWQR